MPQVMLQEAKTGPRNTPMAWKTIFGWAVFGPFQASSNHNQSVLSALILSIPTESPAEHLLTRFWEVEELSSESPTFTPEEEAVQVHYAKTHSYLSSSHRYQVTLPRKTGIPALGESRPQALQRYRANEQSVLRKGTWKDFQSVVQEYLDLGHAQPISKEILATSTESFYLPGHARCV